MTTVATPISGPSNFHMTALRTLLYKRLGRQYSKFSMKVRPGKLASSLIGTLAYIRGTLDYIRGVPF